MKLFLTIIFSFTLFGCSLVDENETNNKNIAANTIFSEMKDDGFILYNKKNENTYIQTICKEYNLNVINIDDICINPIKLKKHEYLIGALVQKQPVEIHLRQNIHKIVLENGDFYYSISDNSFHPLDKINLYPIDPNIVLTLRELKEQKAIEDFDFILGDFRIKVLNKWHSINESMLNSLKLLTNYVDKEYYYEAFLYSISINNTLIEKDTSGHIYPNLVKDKDEKDFFLVYGFNTDVNMNTSDIYTYMSFSAYSMVDIENNLVSISFDYSNYILELNDENKIFDGSKYFIKFDDPELLMTLIDTSILTTFVYEDPSGNLKSYKRIINITPENLKNNIFCLRLIEIIKISHKI